MRTPGAPLLAILALTAAPLAAQNGSLLRGRVLAPSGQGVAGALVIRVSPAVDTTRADSAGRYAVAHLPAGRHVFQVRHAGYETIEMELNLTGDTTLEVDVPLQPAAEPALAGGRLDQVGFTSRKAENRGRRGVLFIGPDEIVTRQPLRLTDLLANAQDIQVRQEGNIKVVYGDGGRCTLPIWIDGNQESTLSTTRGVDEAAPIETVAAIEIYPRDTQLPEQFVQTAAQTASGPATPRLGRRSGGTSSYETRTTHCGAIVIWTR